MKRFAQQFKKQSQKTKLTPAEQSLLRERITTFMEYHPLQYEGRATSHEISLGDSFILARRTVWHKFGFSLMALSVMVVVILPAVAEYTVPGDVLYPVKVMLNEEVRSTFARTPYQKVEWEAKLIERRISEAHILAKAGLLTPEVQEDVALAVNQHLSNASAEIAILRGENNDDEAILANMALSSVFEVHGVAFGSNGVDSMSELNTTISSTSKLAEAIEEGRLESSLPSEGKISYVRLMAEIEKQTTRAYERLESIKKVLPQQEVLDINKRLEDINTRISVATEQIEEDRDESIEELIQTLLDTQKLITFMNDINVRATVKVDDIVSISPTFDDKSAEFTVAIEQLKSETGKIELSLKAIPLDEKSAEVASSIQEINDYIRLVDSTTLTSITLRSFENKLQEVIELKNKLTDILIQLGVVLGTDLKLEIGTSSPTTTANN